jgi:hypothetical protein
MQPRNNTKLEQAFLYCPGPEQEEQRGFGPGPEGKGFEFELPTKGGGDTAVASAMGLSRGAAFNGSVTAGDFAPGEAGIEALSLGTQTRRGPFFSGDGRRESFSDDGRPLALK